MNGDTLTKDKTDFVSVLPRDTFDAALHLADDIREAFAHRLGVSSDALGRFTRIGNDGGWDYFTGETSNHREYIGRVRLVFGDGGKLTVDAGVKYL